VARSDPFPTATREPGIGPALSLKGRLSVNVGAGCTLGRKSAPFDLPAARGVDPRRSAEPGLESLATPAAHGIQT
jgi:hypothetical protein